MSAPELLSHDLTGRVVPLPFPPPFWSTVLSPGLWGNPEPSNLPALILPTVYSAPGFQIGEGPLIQTPNMILQLCELCKDLKGRHRVF